MILTEDLISAYKQMLSNPEKHDLPFPSLREIFLPSDTAIAKHLVYDKYQRIIDKNIPKIIFYIIMDEIFPQKKAEDGNLGYVVKFKE